ncbi:MAG: DUF4377 domain-containing protein, partial [Desulfobacterales bacterium]|nr:DUF4377 domain-containing protein [Desulfobacterales bacterium]
MSVKKKTVFIISLITVFIAGTLYADKWEQSYEEEYETKTLLINSSLADCVGVSPRKCMLVRETESDEWEFFYDEIENFFYKEGYFYEITVRVTEIDNPPI